MESIQDKQHGPGVAQQSSKQNNTTIQVPDNGSIQQSRYVAAIARHADCRGLASPATDVQDGVTYTFDFYHPESGKMFKVFKRDDLAEYDQYVRYPGDVSIIVNVDDQPGCEYEEESCGGYLCIILPCELSAMLHEVDVTYVYFHGYLCNFSNDYPDGMTAWDAIQPNVCCCG